MTWTLAGSAVGLCSPSAASCWFSFLLRWTSALQRIIWRQRCMILFCIKEDTGGGNIFPRLLCILVMKACISVTSPVLLTEWMSSFEVTWREQQKSERRPALFLTQTHAVWMIWLGMPLKYRHPNSLHGPWSCKEGKGTCGNWQSERFRWQLGLRQLSQQHGLLQPNYREQYGNVVLSEGTSDWDLSPLLTRWRHSCIVLSYCFPNIYQSDYVITSYFSLSCKVL